MALLTELGRGGSKAKAESGKAETGRNPGGKAWSGWCWFRGVGSVRVRKSRLQAGAPEISGTLPGCGVWAKAGPGVSRGSTPGHFLATRRVGWEAGAAKDE